MTLIKLVGLVFFLILFVTTTAAWLVGCVGVVVHSLRMISRRQDSFRLWRDVPFVYALFLGKLSLLIYDEYLTTQGKDSRRKTLRWIRILGLATLGGTVLIVVNENFLHLGKY